MALTCYLEWIPLDWFGFRIPNLAAKMTSPINCVWRGPGWRTLRTIERFNFDRHYLDQYSEPATPGATGGLIAYYNPDMDSYWHNQ